MSPEQPYAEQAAPPLSADQLAALKAAESDLAADLKEAGIEAKSRVRSLTPELLEVIEETERRDYVRRMADAELARDLFASDARLARVFAVSGVFSDIKGTTPEQAIATAMTKIRMGRAWGLHEADAMQHIFFTNGRPAVGNEIIASKLKQAGWEWDVRWYEDREGTCIGCGIFPKRWVSDRYRYLEEVDPGDPDGKRLRKVEVKFTKQDADRAMIWEKGKQIKLSQKWNYMAWPGDMYFWRCIARMKRRYAPDILAGAASVDEAREAEPEQPQPLRATMDMSKFRPSYEPNRGHDAAAAPQGHQDAPPAKDTQVAAQPEKGATAANAAPPAATPEKIPTDASSGTGTSSDDGRGTPASPAGPAPAPPEEKGTPFARVKFGQRPGSK